MSMTFHTAFLAALTAFCIAPLVAGEGERAPMQAKVVADRADLRCGPGDQFYVTQRLSAGTVVEVYRRESGGWFAIRPPGKSFSWVRADQLAETGQSGVGRVVGRDVVAWVGSVHQQRKEHQWQVRLDEDERVEILGREKTQILPQWPPAEYYRISPPAGEYRWIHERDLKPIQDDASISAESGVQLADFRIVLEQAEDASPGGDLFVARKDSRPPDDFRPLPKRSPSNQRPRNGGATNNRAGFERNLRDLDLKLAVSVARPPASWRLSDLEPALKALAGEAESTLQRGRAEVLLDRFAEYRELEKRYAKLEDSELFEPARDAATERPDRRNAGQPAFEARFDGSGWLLPVHSSKRESPPYALLDDDGKILQFVSPAPGLNLHRYLRQEVGVFGQRSQTTLLDKPLLTAHRIVDLDRHRQTTADGRGWMALNGPALR